MGANTESRYRGRKGIPASGIVSLLGLVTSPPAPRHPRSRLSTLGRRRLLRRGLAAPCSGRGNWPPKAVSEPFAGVKCKPFHFVLTRKYQIALCAQIFIGTRCFLCTSVPWPWYPSKDLLVPPLRIYELPTIYESVSSWFRPQNRNCPFAVSSIVPWKMARRFSHLHLLPLMS